LAALRNDIQLDALLKQAFGNDEAHDIISLAWYLASEGAALSDSDAWLDHFESPRGRSISNQDITRLLDKMDYDSVLAFYKGWLASLEKTNDRALYDLTSISWSGKSLDFAGWGRNQRGDKPPQVNYALLCSRNAAMPLFAWPLAGSISDARTLKTTLRFLDKLGYKPGCLMMDRGFASLENITYMFRHGHTFLQSLRLNAGMDSEHR
jgi:hypothetical protein